MAGKSKSIIDKALLESEQIEKAFEANAKEVLTRTMSSEIEEMVRESLEDSIGLTEDDDMEVEMDLDLELDDSDVDLELDDMDIDAGGAGEGDLDLGDMDDMDLDLDDEDVDVIDLTDADQSDVIKVFKKMGPDDEIEVVQDGDNVDIKDTETGAEYRVELGGAMGADDMEGLDDMGGIEDLDLDLDSALGGMDDMEDLDLDADMDDEDGDDVDININMDDEEGDDDLEEGVIYEIEIEVEDDEDDEDEDEVTEDLARTRGRASQGNRYTGASHHPKSKNESRKPMNTKMIKENKVLKNNFSKVQGENKQLKEDYNKLVGALKQFRTKLNEVAVFNSNLTYSVRLFTENATTKEEKLDIIKRFDEVKSLKESKNVYKQLVSEVSKSTPIKESVEDKINKTNTNGSSAKMNESKVYVNPELEKMKKLWSYEYKN